MCERVKFRAKLRSAVCLGSRAILLCTALTAGAAPPAPGTPVSFLACPQARDTGPDTDLCFFAEYAGVRYSLANPSDWGMPQLKHRVLVEGRVKEGPETCGAVPIEGRAAVLPEIDASCNDIVPFDGKIKGVPGGVFNSGNPAQRAYAQSLAQRAAQDPALSVEPAIPDPDPPPTPAPPFETRRLVIIYPFNSTRSSGPDMVQLRDLATFVKVARARRVEVVGYRGDARLQDGSQLSEQERIAQARAEKIATVLKGIGVQGDLIHVRWEPHALPGRGVDDWRNRRVEVTATP